MYLYKRTRVITYVALGLSLLLFVHYIGLKLSYEYLYLEELNGMVVEITPNNDGVKLILKDRKKKVYSI